MNKDSLNAKFNQNQFIQSRIWFPKQLLIFCQQIFVLQHNLVRKTYPLLISDMGEVFDHPQNSALIWTNVYKTRDKEASNISLSTVNH